MLLILWDRGKRDPMLLILWDRGKRDPMLLILWDRGKRDPMLLILPLKKIKYVTNTRYSFIILDFKSMILFQLKIKILAVSCGIYNSPEQSVAHCLFSFSCDIKYA